MTSVQASKYWPKSRTIETFIADKAFKDQLIQWLYATGHIHDNEEITKIIIDLPKSIPLKWTVKATRGTKRDDKEGP